MGAVCSSGVGGNIQAFTVKEVFPTILTEWIETIPDTDLRKDLSPAKEEGWIFDPASENIDKPLGNYDD